MSTQALTPVSIQVIVGSTRQGRFSEKPAAWIMQELQKRSTVKAELVDLRDYPLPFFEEATSPSMIQEPYAHPVVAKWTKKVAQADGYIIVTPEYNHGYPAVLKNALDYVYTEWNRKAVGFVSYGSVGGGRSIEQLRQVAVELQMAPVRSSVHIAWAEYMAAVKGQPDAFAPLEQQANTLLDQLIWWTTALKAART